MEIVKATAPALEKHGLAITNAMYARLFQNKEIEAMFDRAAQTSGEQPKRLAAAILAYAKNIDKLQNLGSAVSRSEEHTSELQSLMRISYAVFCLKKKKRHTANTRILHHSRSTND